MNSWTKEPPTEPGWYWWRHPRFQPLPEPVTSWANMAEGGEWWPERIEEPET